MAEKETAIEETKKVDINKEVAKLNKMELKLGLRERVSKKINCVFYLQKKYYRKKTQKMKKVGDTFTFENGTYILDDRYAVQIGRKSYLFFDVNNPIPKAFTSEFNPARNSKVLDVLIGKRTLKALFGNPDKWYLILAILGLGTGAGISIVFTILLMIGKVVIK